MRTSPANAVNPAGSTNVFRAAHNYFGSTAYKVQSHIRKNNILNRAVLELLGIDLPTALTELVARNWKKAAEDFFRITLYMGVIMLVPLGLIPIWNKISKKVNKLPDEFNGMFLHQFEDLVPDKNNEEGLEEFKQKLIKHEGPGGEEKVKRFLGNDPALHKQKLIELKNKLLKAKADVMKMDVTSAGLLSYQVPWIMVALSKKFLGVVGFSGELDYLSESERERSSAMFEKTSVLRYFAGYIPSILGGLWYPKKVSEAASKTQNEIDNGGWFSKFIRKNLKQFDYFNKIFSNRLNLFGTFIFGASAGFLCSIRSLNEGIERVLRLAVAFPMLFWGDKWLHYKFAQMSDKKNDTKLVDYEAPKELGVPKLKSLDDLEKDYHDAKDAGNVKGANKAFQSIKTSNKLWWLSILVDAVLMGFGLTGANIAGTKMRVERGIY